MASLLNDVPSHPTGKDEGNVVAYLGGESELRIRSYGVFHRINESMVLGMHPVFAYLRRIRIAPPIDTWFWNRLSALLLQEAYVIPTVY